MAAVWFRFRAELSARWRGLLGLALLVGFAGGVTLAAAAGARRTDTAYPRLVRETRAWDVLVNPDNGTDSALTAHEVAGLSEVVRAGRVDGLAVSPRNVQSPSDLFEGYGIVLGADRAVGRTFGRPKLLAGHMPGLHRPYDILVNSLLAERRGLHVGDELPSVALDEQALTGLESLTDAAAGLSAIREGRIGIPITLRVTGIGVFPDDIVLDQGFQESQMILSPAFRERHPEAAVSYWGEMVRLRHGAADVARFRRDVEAFVPGEAIAFQTRRSTSAKVDRAVRPYVGALGIFAVVVAVTGVFIVGQAIARQSAIDARDHAVLSALGFGRSQRFVASALDIAIVGIVGALVAGALALALSPLMPVGPARTAEPHPGLHVDGTVVGLGMVIIVLAVTVLGAVLAWRAARVATDEARADRPSTVAQALAAIGAPVPVSAGVRMALEPGKGRTAVPVRTTLVGASLALATVIGALGVAASIQHLVATPRLFGWNWDVQLSVVGADSSPAADILDKSKIVERSSTMALSDIRLPGGSVPALGIDTGRRAVPPSLVGGRAPRHAWEIALGARTLRALGLGIGDRVAVTANDGTQHRLRIVGTVVLPGLGTYPGSDKTALGEGAVVTRSALTELGPDFGRSELTVRFLPGTSAAAQHRLVHQVRDVIAAQSPEDESPSVSASRLPADVISYESVRSTPLVLAGVLALLAVATLVHALVTAIRRRRRDFALLGTLGFTRRQVAATVAWQATTVGALAIVIGIPLGIIAGRVAWTALANDLGTVAEPRVSLLGVLLAVPAVLLVTNAIAYLPGRAAARARPAVVLRSE